MVADRKTKTAKIIWRRNGAHFGIRGHRLSLHNSGLSCNPRECNDDWPYRKL